MWTGRPEHSAWMCVGVICDVMSATEDFGDKVRILFSLCSNYKKGGTSIEAIEEGQELQCMIRRRTIVDRDPNF